MPANASVLAVKSALKAEKHRARCDEFVLKPSVRACVEQQELRRKRRNNDATLTQNTLSELVASGERDPEATLLAPKVLDYTDRDRIHSRGTSMDWFRLRPRTGAYGTEDSRRGEGEHSEQIFPGSALLLKRKLLEKVGFLDEGFFLIHEDADLCLRNLKAGFKNVCVPNAHVYHKLSKTLNAYPFLSQYYSSRNFLYLAKAHAGFRGRVQAALGLIARLLQNACLWPFSRADEKQVLAGFFAGVRDYCRGKRGKYS